MINSQPTKLSQVQPSPASKDAKMAAIEAAQKLKNPALAPTPALRLQATNAKLLRLYADPEFKKLKDDNKLFVLRHYYDKYVEPSLKDLNIAPPTFQEWAHGKHSAFYDKDRRPVEPVTGAFWAGMNEGTTDVMKLARNVLSYKLTNTPKFAGPQKVADKLAAIIDKHINGWERVDQRYHTVFQTNNSAGAWAANTAGHIIGEGPAYLAVDAATAGVGAIPEVAGTTAKIAQAAPKSLKLLKMLKASGEVFSVDKAEGKDTHTAASDAAVTFGMEGLLAGARTGLKKLFKKAPEETAAMAFKGTQLAVGGKPFVNSVEMEEERALGNKDNKRLGPGSDDSGSKGSGPKLLSAVPKDNPALKEAAHHEQALRENLARKYFPHKAEAAGDKSVWRNLSAAQKAKVKAHITALTKLSAEIMPLVQPELQTMANEKMITESDITPAQIEFTKAVQQLTGLDPAKILTDIQAQEIEHELNINTPAEQIDSAISEADEYEPGEGASATLKAGYSISYKRANNKLTPKELVSSDADKFIHGTIKYLENSPATSTGKIYFEHPEHHLLWIANNSKAPASVKGKAAKLLSQEFGHSSDTITRRAGWLREHVNDLRRTGKLSTEGNIYRSTKLSPRSHGTKWQSQLYTTDTLAAQIKTIKGLLKTNPKLKTQLIPVLQELVRLKNSGATPGKVGQRASELDNVMQALGRFK